MATLLVTTIPFLVLYTVISLVSQNECTRNHRSRRTGDKTQRFRRCNWSLRQRRRITPFHRTQASLRLTLPVIDILQVNYSKFTLPDFFLGACVDTGAASSVCGLRQARAYCKSINRQLHMQPSLRRFRFGNGCQNSLGTMEIRIPTPIGSIIRKEVDVVNADIPLLLGLDLMKEFGFIIDLNQMTIRQAIESWEVRLSEKMGHLFLEWDNSTILFTRAELEKLHLQFYHPSAKKLFNLVKRARPSAVDTQTLKLLEEISRKCATCAAFAARGLRFRVSMPDEDIVFNQTLSMDLMFLDGRPVLHVVDNATGFGNSVFLNGQSVDDIWTSFLKIWATIYPGYPNKLRADQGSVFTSARW